MKRLSILGSTGSIGTSALDVVSVNTDRFKVAALSAGRNMRLLAEQIEAFGPSLVAVIDEEHAEVLRGLLNPSCRVDIVTGPTGYIQAATLPDADIVLSAMVGAPGLVPTLAAIEAGKDVALANKETMVIAGALVMDKARAKGVRILPVDSEHSAVFQCLEGQKKKFVKRIILTASGGPFLHYSAEEMALAGPDAALKHPNWSMGQKITIDSASMMNKGLEIIEARWLFDIPYDRIDVVIHPQSIIHSMVEFEDGSVIAQLGQPDMRVPISYALAYPDRVDNTVGGLDFTALSPLSFLKPDWDRFPCLGLARQAGKLGGIMPSVLNAANEIAVEHYLGRKIRFTDIPRAVAAVMDQYMPTSYATDVDGLLAADRAARKMANDYMKELVN